MNNNVVWIILLTRFFYWAPLTSVSYRYLMTRLPVLLNIQFKPIIYLNMSFWLKSTKFDWEMFNQFHSSFAILWQGCQILKPYSKGKLSIATSSPINYCSSPENLSNQNRLIDASCFTAAYLKVLPCLEARPQIPFAFAHELIFKSHAFFCCRFFFSFRNLFLIRNQSVSLRFYTFC